RFPSAHDAVLAAVEMQQAVTRAGGPPFGIRVGVNAGDVVDADDDMSGNVVVVARRLCDAAASGQILVADVVRLPAGTRFDITFYAVGELTIEGFPSPDTAFSVPWTPLPAD